MKKVKFGIIGMGNMGSGHLSYFYDGKIENGVVSAIADVKAARLEAAKRTIRANISAILRARNSSTMQMWMRSSLQCRTTITRLWRSGR